MRPNTILIAKMGTSELWALLQYLLTQPNAGEIERELSDLNLIKVIKKEIDNRCVKLILTNTELKVKK